MSVQQTTPAPPVEAGQVWRLRHPWGGMDHTVTAVHPAGVAWQTSRGDAGFTRWQEWNEKMVPRHV